MKACFAIVAALSMPAYAEIAYVAHDPHGTVELHTETGACLSGSLMAMFVFHDGTKVPGCWRVRVADHVVSIAFMDGDALWVALDRLKKPFST